MFILSKIPGAGIGTVMQTGWTLCFEVYFYVLFAVLLNWPRKYFLLGLGLVFAGGTILGAVTGHVPPAATVATNPILFEFYFGALTGFLFIKGWFIPRPAAMAAVILGIILLIVTGQANVGELARPILWGLPCAAILMGAISLERAGLKTPSFLVDLGNSSYSLYLVHPFILPAFGKIWLMLHLSQRAGPVIPGLMAFVCSIGAGHAVYLVLEKPVTTRLARAWGTRKPVNL